MRKSSLAVLKAGFGLKFSFPKLRGGRTLTFSSLRILCMVVFVFVAMGVSGFGGSDGDCCRMSCGRSIAAWPGDLGDSNACL